MNPAKCKPMKFVLMGLMNLLKAFSTLGTLLEPLYPTGSGPTGSGPSLAAQLMDSGSGRSSTLTVAEKLELLQAQKILMVYGSPFAHGVDELRRHVSDADIHASAVFDRTRVLCENNVELDIQGISSSVFTGRNTSGKQESEGDLLLKYTEASPTGNNMLPDFFRTQVPHALQPGETTYVRTQFNNPRALAPAVDHYVYSLKCTSQFDDYYDLVNLRVDLVKYRELLSERGRVPVQSVADTRICVERSSNLLCFGKRSEDALSGLTSSMVACSKSHSGDGKIPNNVLCHIVANLNVRPQALLALPQELCEVRLLVVQGFQNPLYKFYAAAPKILISDGPDAVSAEPVAINVRPTQLVFGKAYAAVLAAYVTVYDSTRKDFYDIWHRFEKPVCVDGKVVTGDPTGPFWDAAKIALDKALDAFESLKVISPRNGLAYSGFVSPCPTEKLTGFGVFKLEEATGGSSTLSSGTSSPPMPFLDATRKCKSKQRFFVSHTCQRGVPHSSVVVFPPDTPVARFVFGTGLEVLSGSFSASNLAPVPDSLPLGAFGDLYGCSTEIFLLKAPIGKELRSSVKTVIRSTQLHILELLEGSIGDPALMDASTARTNAIIILHPACPDANLSSLLASVDLTVVSQVRGAQALVLLFHKKKYYVLQQSVTYGPFLVVPVGSDVTPLMEAVLLGTEREQSIEVPFPFFVASGCRKVVFANSYICVDTVLAAIKVKSTDSLLKHKADIVNLFQQLQYMLNRKDLEHIKQQVLTDIAASHEQQSAQKGLTVEEIRHAYLTGGRLPTRPPRNKNTSELCGVILTMFSRLGMASVGHQGKTEAQEKAATQLNVGAGHAARIMEKAAVRSFMSSLSQDELVTLLLEKSCMAPMLSIGNPVDVLGLLHTSVCATEKIINAYEKLDTACLQIDIGNTIHSSSLVRKTLSLLDTSSHALQPGTREDGTTYTGILVAPALEVDKTKIAMPLPVSFFTATTLVSRNWDQSALELDGVSECIEQLVMEIQITKGFSREKPSNRQAVFVFLICLVVDLIKRAIPFAKQGVIFLHTTKNIQQMKRFQTLSARVRVGETLSDDLAIELSEICNDLFSQGGDFFESGTVVVRCALGLLFALAGSAPIPLSIRELGLVLSNFSEPDHHAWYPLVAKACIHFSGCEATGMILNNKRCITHFVFKKLLQEHFNVLALNKIERDKNASSADMKLRKMLLSILRAYGVIAFRLLTISLSTKRAETAAAALTGYTAEIKGYYAAQMQAGKAQKLRGGKYKMPSGAAAYLRDLLVALSEKDLRFSDSLLSLLQAVFHTQMRYGATNNNEIQDLLVVLGFGKNGLPTALKISHVDESGGCVLYKLRLQLRGSTADTTIGTRWLDSVHRHHETNTFTPWHVHPDDANAANLLFKQRLAIYFGELDGTAANEVAATEVAEQKMKTPDTLRQQMISLALTRCPFKKFHAYGRRADSLLVLLGLLMHDTNVTQQTLDDIWRLSGQDKSRIQLDPLYQQLSLAGVAQLDHANFIRDVVFCLAEEYPHHLDKGLARCLTLFPEASQEAASGKAHFFQPSVPLSNPDPTSTAPMTPIIQGTNALFQFDYEGEDEEEDDEWFPV